MITVPVQIKDNVLKKLNDIVLNKEDIYTIQAFIKELIKEDIKEHNLKDLHKQNYKLINIIVDKELKESIVKIVKADDFFITQTAYINFLIYKYIYEEKA